MTFAAARRLAIGGRHLAYHDTHDDDPEGFALAVASFLEEL